MAQEQVPKKEVTELLCAWGQGEKGALEQLIPLVHDHLCRLASGFLSAERRNHTLQSGALVNEVYLRLVDLDRISWNDRAHFFALCARFMRRILVDHARQAGSSKRGDAVMRLSLDALEQVADAPRDASLVDLDEALEALAVKDAQAARIIELRYFGGLNRDEIATVLGTSSATVTRRWRLARAWLYKTLRDGCDIPSGAGDG